MDKIGVQWDQQHDGCADEFDRMLANHVADDEHGLIVVYTTDDVATWAG